MGLSRRSAPLDGRLRGAAIPEADREAPLAIGKAERIPDAGWAGRSARRPSLTPAALHLLAHRVGAGRQTREDVRSRGVGCRRCSDRAGELDHPVRKTGVAQNSVIEHGPRNHRGPRGGRRRRGGRRGRGRWILKYAQPLMGVQLPRDRAMLDTQTVVANGAPWKLGHACEERAGDQGEKYWQGSHRSLPACGVQLKEGATRGTPRWIRVLA